MKKLTILFLMLGFVLTASASGMPNDTVSLGQAFGHCFSTVSYVVWLVIATIIAAGLVYVNITMQRSTDGNKLLYLAALLIFTFALLMRPVEVANNTNYKY